jgi:hypothetical protein
MKRKIKFDGLYRMNNAVVNDPDQSPQQDKGQAARNAMDDISSSPQSLMCAGPRSLVTSKNALCK